jgi:hypothetical protein
LTLTWIDADDGGRGTTQTIGFLTQVDIRVSAELVNGKYQFKAILLRPAAAS